MIRRALSAAAGTLALAALAAAPIAGASAPVGCQPGLPGTQYRAGGVAAGPGSAALPVACVVSTGYASSESTIGVTPRGTVLYSPALSENSVARSTDAGADWYLAYPFDEQFTALWNTDDPYLYVDRRTGRIFWSHATGPTRTAPLLVSNSPLPSGIPTAVAAAYGFQVYSSSDEGASWHTADYSTAATGDWDKVFTGPPAAGAARPSGYPDVVYFCANAPTEAVGPGRQCYRSLDGGTTFAPAGYVFPSAQQPLDQCQALLANNGAVGPDGTVYQPVTCANGAYVAVSRDDGTTYTWHRVTGAPPASGIAGVTTGVGGVQVAVDDGGEVYAMWSTGQRVMVARSADHAATFSPALDLTVPGLRLVALPALAAGPAGHVGVAYYGSTDSKATRLSAYLTSTATGASASPLFTSAALNPPAAPIFQPSGVSPRADYIGAAFDEQGTLWAGAVRQTGPPDAKGDVGTAGLVAHLVPPAAAHVDLCSRPASELLGRSVGPVSLGMTRAQARRQFTRSSTHGRQFMDYFCSGENGIRVGYPSARLLRSAPATVRRQTRGRVVLILVSARQSALYGLRPGGSLARAPRRLRISQPFRIGRNTWYLADGTGVSGVLKVRSGVIDEVGIANANLVAGRRRAENFLRSFQ